ncbi:MAG: hypothetical protein PVS2B2_12210 [Candidatus Acidiferrum sp.]
MKTQDKGRKWMWWFLGVVAALQMYFVRELLAALAMFAVGFAAIAMVIGSVYMMQKAWEAGVGRLAASRNGFLLAARRGVSAVEELGMRPFRRPNSGLAQ